MLELNVLCPVDYALNKFVLTKTNEGYLKGHERFVGRTVEVLVEGPAKSGENMMSGYTPNNKLTHFESTDESLIGKFVKVKITKANTWFMIGELVE